MLNMSCLKCDLNKVYPRFKQELVKANIVRQV